MWGTARLLLLRRGVEMSARLTEDAHPEMDETGEGHTTQRHHTVMRTS
jgi:hypothetical protein